ncbi:papilin-like isoform X3 [Stegodyphus dumicola]|uniref:papilin-like isoform X3 n=1 Tax=Stegodyphus dumicola TaxID=202533 RepID=UPI0015A82B8B|nr:papilin-like isoform X3 [Stegodyphus dumicola]
MCQFNLVLFTGKYYSWLPYYNAQKPCELNCMPSDGNFYIRLDRKVIDGTRCRNNGSLDVCVEGLCLPVGCDNILGSKTKEDHCRVCGGDGSSCQVVQGTIDSKDFDIGYNDLLLIPVGATSILIQEVNPSNKNYLAIRNAAGDFYLNGNRRIEFSGERALAGTIFTYERKPQAQEILTARGPTTEPIFIVVLYLEPNLGISYEYYVPANSTYPDNYIWVFGDFEACSQTCGGGTQVRPVRCIRKSHRDIVDDKLCDPALKPDVNSSCNSQALFSNTILDASGLWNFQHHLRRLTISSSPTGQSADSPTNYGWKFGHWSECTQTCGGGSQFRLVFCYQHFEENSSLVDEEMCQESKPIFMRACNLDSKCPDWVIGKWSECDSPCGSGNHTRTVECRSKENDEVIEESLCDSVRKPTDFQNCNLGPCEGVEWIVSDWSGCSAICGNGVQSRVVFCGVWHDESVIKIEDKSCDPLKKFDEFQNCSSAPCEGVWFAGPWSNCSVPCGGGERTRNTVCYHDDSVEDVSLCDPAEEPFDKETCNMASCEEVSEVCRSPKEAGPCRNFTIKWFFDIAYGGCSRFWYGGCDGNGNVFASKDECENTCVNPDGPEACLLPQIVGPCGAEIPSWYYDPGSKRCEPFNYGGCLGNNNRFVSKLLCEQKCNHLQPVNVCMLPKEPGPCLGYYRMWYYDSIYNICKSFVYGGCDGNKNRFEKRTDCEQLCVDKTSKEPANILSGKNFIEARIGESAELPCNAVGWPKPTVTWWRETKMLPLSNRQYEQLANYSLLIRSVVYEDKGEYSCHAFNGIGSGSIYKVTLILELQSVPHAPNNEDGEHSTTDEPLATYDGPKYPDDAR